jgi:hypothetical protein
MDNGPLHGTQTMLRTAAKYSNLADRWQSQALVVTTRVAAATVDVRAVHSLQTEGRRFESDRRLRRSGRSEAPFVLGTGPL